VTACRDFTKQKKTEDCSIQNKLLKSLRFSLTCRWKNIVHKDEDGLLGAKLDPLPNHIDKLTHCQVCRDQIPANKGYTMNFPEATVLFGPRVCPSRGLFRKTSKNNLKLV
jgi:hypothetical protein